MEKTYVSIQTSLTTTVIVGLFFVGLGYLNSKKPTNNKNYILDTQNLLKNTIPETTVDTDEMEKIWNDIILETDFYTKYKYLDNSWGFAKMLNNNNSFFKFN